MSASVSCVVVQLDKRSLLKKSALGLSSVVCEEQVCIRAQARVSLMHEVRRFCAGVLLHGGVLCLFVLLSALQARCRICVRVVLCFYVLP